MGVDRWSALWQAASRAIQPLAGAMVMKRIEARPIRPIEAEYPETAEPTLAVALTIAIAIVVTLCGIMLRLA